MCVMSFIGDQYRDDFPKRWPTIPIQPWIYPNTKTPSDTPHEFSPTQDALDECTVCDKPRGHSVHAFFEALKRKAPDSIVVDKATYDALKAEVEELRELLLAARRFDEATGQKDCEMDEKVAFLKRLAEWLEVDLSTVFGDAEPHVGGWTHIDIYVENPTDLPEPNFNENPDHPVIKLIDKIGKTAFKWSAKNEIDVHVDGALNADPPGWAS